MSADNSAHFITQIASALSSDGQAAQLKFTRASGEVVNIDFPAAAMGGLIAAITGALERLVERQKSIGLEPSALVDRQARPAKLRGVIAPGGKPMLSVETASGINHTFAIDPIDIRPLITWFERLEQTIQVSDSRPH